MSTYCGSPAGTSQLALKRPANDRCQKQLFALLSSWYMQEGGPSQGSFMASLIGPRDGCSLMPADSAFRMISSVSQPTQQSCSATASHDSGELPPPCSLLCHWLFQKWRDFLRRWRFIGQDAFRRLGSNVPCTCTWSSPQLSIQQTH
jgi:hypothetical protein